MHNLNNACAIIIRLEARLKKKILDSFTAHFGGVHAFGYNSAKREPIWMKSGALWVHCRGLGLADFGRDPISSDSWRAKRSFLFVC